MAHRPRKLAIYKRNIYVYVALKPSALLNPLNMENDKQPYALICQVEGIVTCTYNETEHHTRHDWYSLFCMPEESAKMRAAMDEFVEFVKREGVTKHLVNNKKTTGAFSEDDIAWIERHHTPNQIAAGIKYMAVVESEDFFSKLSTQEWRDHEQAQAHFETRLFETLEEAREWLASV